MVRLHDKEVFEPFGSRQRPGHARPKANAPGLIVRVALVSLAHGTGGASAPVRRMRNGHSAVDRLGSKHRRSVRLRSERRPASVPAKDPGESVVTAQIVDLAHYRSIMARKGDRVSRARRSAFGQAASQTGEADCRPDLPALDARVPRSEPRHEIEGLCAPRLTLNGKRAVIRNVSRHGLMASIEMSAVPGSRVLAILAGSRPISARVVWQERGLVGLDLPVDWPAAVV